MRPLLSDVRCDVSPPRPHLSALVMTGREARLGTDTELDERKFRNNLSQLIGDFRRIFQEYHQLCRAVYEFLSLAEEYSEKRYSRNFLSASG